ncbi:MAG: response regulator [Elusimicrobia bacterium]|nr:response regulator [Elusimicrobiota bacterium]
MAINVAVVTDDLLLSEKIIKALDYNYNLRFFNYSDFIIEEIEKINPELLIVDIISIPKYFTGFIERIRNTSFLSSKKILILSQNKKIDLIIGEQSKVNAYFTKPVDFDELNTAIKNNIKRNGPIVVIDYDKEFLELTELFLKSNGYEVITIENSLKAIDTIRKTHPSLVIVDLIMPDKDGFEIISELFGEEKKYDIPVIAVSAISFNKLNKKGIISGYPEYISRDLTPELIKELVENSISNVFVSEDEKIKVLLADDELGLLLLLRESLEMAGFKVFTASDGKEAVEKIYDLNPDIAVIDYNMPFKNGMDVAIEIKNNPLYSHMPIIIVTGKSDKETKIKALNMGIDDYIIKPVDTDELVARIRMIVKRNRLVLDANPLSKLPGNPSIQSRIEKAIEKNEKFAVLYVDLNNFKAYNDVYGFEAGDRVIKTLSDILVNIIMPEFSSFDFIGHIGGDDFIVLTTVDRAEAVAKKIINNFNQIVPSFYNDSDRKNGYIITSDRSGNVMKFPFLSVSIGIVHNLHKPLRSYAQVSHIGSELKKAAKSAGVSSYIMDRRHS